MSCVLVLCILLLVSQVEMLPVYLVKPLKNPEGMVGSEELAAPSGQMDVTVDVAVGPVELAAPSGQMNVTVDVPVGPVELAAPSGQMDMTVDVNRNLSRHKRSTLNNNGHYKCPKGMTENWPKGPCVSCEYYMRHHDTDECPGNW